MVDSDTFRDQLAITYPTYGHALWDPSPTKPDRPVEVGDVGFIRWGRFHRLFNALLPADDPSQVPRLVPEGHEPLVPGLPDHINKGSLNCGHYCSAGVAVELESDHFANSPDDVPQLSFIGPRRQKGAVLYLPVKARRENTLAQNEFGKWMIEHIDGWFAFARRLGVVEHMEDIILVTGCDRTRSWMNIAFMGNSVNSRVSFGAAVHDPNNSINFQFSPGNVQGAVVNQGPEGTNLSENQCVFIRGFRAARTFRLLPKHLKGAADTPPDPEGHGGEPDMGLVSIPAITKHRDPLLLLLRHIVEEATDCDIVLVHDDDLLKIVGTESGMAPDALQPDVLMDLLHRSNIEMHKDVRVVTTSNGPNIGIVFGRMATISTLSKWQNWARKSSPRLTYESSIPSSPTLLGSLPLPTIRDDLSISSSSTLLDSLSLPIIRDDLSKYKSRLAQDRVWDVSSQNLLSALPLPRPHLHFLINGEFSARQLYINFAEVDLVFRKRNGLKYSDIVTISAYDLEHPATIPQMTCLRIVCDAIPQWPVDMQVIGTSLTPHRQRRSALPYLTLEDLVHTVHASLHRKISHEEWGRLSTVQETEVARAYTRRYNAAGSDWAVRQQQAEGVKRVDFLFRNTWFKGFTWLQPENGIERLKLLLGQGSNLNFELID